VPFERTTNVPKSGLQELIDDYESEGWTVTTIKQSNNKFTVEARKGDAATGESDGTANSETDVSEPGDGDHDGQEEEPATETDPPADVTVKPPGDLLKRLVAIYKGEKIRHPNLRAVTLAQWMLESGRAKSDLAKLHLNFGGLKWRPEMALFATKISFEAHDGVDNYCKFATIENFVNGYWAFLNRSPYTGWEERAGDAEAFIRFIGPIYTPTAGYADKVLSLAPEAAALLSAVEDVPVLVSSDGATDLGTIVIDPGHGGTTNVPGSSANNAIAKSGVKEKKLTLDFALLLQQALVSQANKAGEKINVVLTRTTDVNVEGSKRAGVAFEHKAKLFLSIHFNGSTDGSVRGTETFYRAKENANLNLADDMAFANDVQRAVLDAIKALDSKVIDRGVKPDTKTLKKALGVLNDKNLRNDDRPDDMCRAALVEIEFISNARADTLLVSGPDAMANRTTVMAALAKGLRQHMKTMP
jgi:N-acetylmuramoyl-L-alanine amidase